MTHTPVLLEECIEGLKIKPDGVYVDATLGRGGHAAEVARRLTTGRLVGIDRDGDAVEEAGAVLSQFAGIVSIVRGDYRDLAGILDSEGIDATDGMLFDLGVSSPQFDDADRGFSYSHDAALDMRMDRRDALTAYEAVNEWPEEKLRSVFYEYGEERHSALIARAIAKKRSEKPIETTIELSDAIVGALPAAARRAGGHPAKRCFQALRIAVNGELDSLQSMLKAASDRLLKGGRLCVVSYHSLEERIVKQTFIEFAKPCTCPKDFPVCVCAASPSMRLITKKPIIPNDAEIGRNPRARSAKLRIAEKI
jgi:16S rRNA (cytosine1402-N4)-methyltransferase